MMVFTVATESIDGQGRYMGRPTHGGRNSGRYVTISTGKATIRSRIHLSTRLVDRSSAHFKDHQTGSSETSPCPTSAPWSFPAPGIIVRAVRPSLGSDKRSARMPRHREVRLAPIVIELVQLRFDGIVVFDIGRMFQLTYDSTTHCPCVGEQSSNTCMRFFADLPQERWRLTGRPMPASPDSRTTCPSPSFARPTSQQ